MTEHLVTFFALFGLVLCAQPSAPSPIAAPLRELPWAQLNFLHTSDIHGWWGGHLQEYATYKSNVVIPKGTPQLNEYAKQFAKGRLSWIREVFAWRWQTEVALLTDSRPSFSADWGDYVSFAKHLHEKADADGSDLLLVDTGDRIEGNAIYDSSKPRGKFTYEIAKEQHIDLICSGNHELYKQASSEGEFYHTVPDFKGNYIASNLDIYNPNTGRLQPLAPRYKKFSTKNQGIRILAFGFIFDFTANANNTVIHKVEDTVKEEWFQEAIRDPDVDLILIFGHVDIRSVEYATIYSTIRSVRWDIPIQFFGGHTHIRDYKMFDSKSVALESGRYMETLGFMSIDGLGTGGTKNCAAVSQKPKLTFSRRYLDNNLFSFHHHSGKTGDNFPTEHGLNVSNQIDLARKSLSLSKRYGCAPHDLWVSRRPYPHEESIFTWLEEQVFPQSVGKSTRVKDGKKAIVITNTGGIRFDIFKGPFTKDSTFLVSPFTSGLRYIKDVPYKAASRVLRLLNNEGPIMEILSEKNIYLQPPENVAAKYRSETTYVDQHSDTFAHKPSAQAVLSFESEPLIPGYTTRDDAGEDGDDTLHSQIQFYNVPNCVQASVGFDAKRDDPEVVDLIYNEFIEKWVILALEYLGEKYSVGDTQYYLEGKSFTDIMTDWVKEHWSVEGECT